MTVLCNKEIKRELCFHLIETVEIIGDRTKKNLDRLVIKILFFTQNLSITESKLIQLNRFSRIEEDE